MPDRLPPPLITRFVLREQLQFCQPEALASLLEREGLNRGLTLTPKASAVLSLAAHETPREALRLLHVAWIQAQAAGVHVVDETLAHQTLQRIGREPSGLEESHRTYLDVLERAGGSLGIRTLAARLGLSKQTVLRTIEPFLVRHGWVSITPRGRTLTVEAEARAAA